MAVAAIIPYVIAAGAVVSAYGLYQQGQASKESGNFNKQVASENAAAALQQSQLQAAQLDREKRLRLGALRASTGANGGEDAGSALDVIGDVASQSELQKQQALYEGDLHARGYTNTANLDQMQADASSNSSSLAAASTLLKGSADTYASYRRLG